LAEDVTSPETVPPLDDWEIIPEEEYQHRLQLEKGEVKAVKNQTEVVNNQITTESGEQIVTPAEMNTTDDDIMDDGSYEKISTFLTHQQEKRLNQVKARERALLNIKKKAQYRAYLMGERGEPDICICTADLNNFGKLKEVRKLVKRGKASRLTKTTDALTTIVSHVDCDVIFLQSVIGSSFAAIQEATKTITDKLQKITNLEWTAYLPKSLTGENYGVFLVNNKPNISVVSVSTVSEALADSCTELQAPSYPRVPLKLNLIVRSSGAGKSRNISIIGFMQKLGLTTPTAEPEECKIRAAEKLKAYAIKLAQAEEEVGDKPLVVLAGYLGNPLTPETFVLSGRVNAGQFTDGTCTLSETIIKEPALTNQSKTEKNKPSLPTKNKRQIDWNCPKEAFSLPVFINILRDGVFRGPRFKEVVNLQDGAKNWEVVKTSKKELQRRYRLKNSKETFLLFIEDRGIALENAQVGNIYNVGAEKFSNGIKGSTLAWVRLNW